MRIGFILIDGYALMSTSAAVEPLRAANLLAGRTLYDMRFLSVAGTAARASAGALFETVPLAEAGTDFDVVFVVAGGNPFVVREPALDAWLRRMDVRRVRLGGISGGSAVLALGGLMEGRRFTIHWEHMEALREISDRFLLERSLFVIDRDRLTCAGGVAPLDMMHALITADHGMDLAREVSDWFIHTRVRPSQDPQRAGLVEKYNVHHPSLLAAIELMDSHIADPLGLEHLAALSGLGLRQFQRLFSERLGTTAMAFYRDLRLAKADDLLRQSPLSILEVGLATGFPNPAHFARCFRARFGLSPGEVRRADKKRGSLPEGRRAP
ncbi:GlxA family transcriptional regulator [Novispirillum sp. DQ9]|uniref:GlxA family transcriptional regulator n=1 Tax=Novispirillum sp. DQ9 TaxID=3398612 RepID=UPI003C7E5B56